MNSYFAYVYDGVIKDQADLDAYKKLEGVPSNIGIGDAKFKDLNGDGKISTYGDKDGDDGDAEYVGSTTPRYSFGLNLGAKWNNFDISVFFQELPSAPCSVKETSPCLGATGGDTRPSSTTARHGTRIARTPIIPA